MPEGTVKENKIWAEQRSKKSSSSKTVAATDVQALVDIAGRRIDGDFSGVRWSLGHEGHCSSRDFEQDLGFDETWGFLINGISVSGAGHVTFYTTSTRNSSSSFVLRKTT